MCNNVNRAVRLTYQPPANSTFLLEKTSNKTLLLFSHNKSAPVKRTGLMLPGKLEVVPVRSLQIDGARSEIRCTWYQRYLIV
jgi:hypothetical protein